ncbi:MAG: Smr/MutS family protein [archaeon]
MQQMPKIDVHGMTGDEASRVTAINLREFERDGYDKVFVIHGHGTGILKQRIRSMLTSHGYKFRPGAYSEGGDGITVVLLAQ